MTAGGENEHGTASEWLAKNEMESTEKVHGEKA